MKRYSPEIESLKSRFPKKKFSEGEILDELEFSSDIDSAYYLKRDKRNCQLIIIIGFILALFATFYFVSQPNNNINGVSSAICKAGHTTFSLSKDIIFYPISLFFIFYGAIIQILLGSVMCYEVGLQVFLNYSIFLENKAFYFLELLIRNTSGYYYILVFIFSLLCMIFSFSILYFESTQLCP